MNRWFVPANHPSAKGSRKTPPTVAAFRLRKSRRARQRSGGDPSCQIGATRTITAAGRSSRKRSITRPAALLVARGDHRESLWPLTMKTTSGWRETAVATSDPMGWFVQPGFRKPVPATERFMTGQPRDRPTISAQLRRPRPALFQPLEYESPRTTTREPAGARGTARGWRSGMTTTGRPVPESARIAGSATLVDGEGAASATTGGSIATTIGRNTSAGATARGPADAKVVKARI